METTDRATAAGTEESGTEEAALLLDVFARLEGRYELDRWHWQAGTPALDICAGAILVQHTAWANVEKALSNLRSAGSMSLEAWRALSDDGLATLLRPAGTPLTKARRLKAFARLVAAQGSLEQLLALPPAELRLLLLATDGIGQETADVILLYGAKQLVNVHDAYTQRLMRRLGIGPDGDRYAEWAGWLARRLPPDVRVYQRFHAGIVVHCKETCRARPKCGGCVLLEVCQFGRAGQVESR